MQRGKSDHYVRDEKFTMFASSMGQGAAVHAGPQGVLMEGGDRAGGRQGQFLCSFFSTKEIHVAPATDLFRAGDAERSFPIFSSSQPRPPFGARGRSSVRYGTRLGDLKENWFLLFSN